MFVVVQTGFGGCPAFGREHSKNNCYGRYRGLSSWTGLYRHRLPHQDPGRSRNPRSHHERHWRTDWWAWAHPNQEVCLISRVVWLFPLLQYFKQSCPTLPIVLNMFTKCLNSLFKATDIRYKHGATIYFTASRRFTLTLPSLSRWASRRRSWRLVLKSSTCSLPTPREERSVGTVVNVRFVIRHVDMYHCK